MKTMSKLVALGTAVTTLATFTFNFTPYASQDNIIKQGISRLQATVLNYKEDLEQAKADYNKLVADLGNARDKLETIYERITGQEWNEEQDILTFNFDEIIKDGDQFASNVDGDELAEMLGIELEEGQEVTTELIANAIQDLQDTVAGLEQDLKDAAAELEATKKAYEDDQTELVAEINNLKTKLQNAQDEANAIIGQANTEQKGQADFVNNAISNLEQQGVEVAEVQTEVPEEDNGEGEVEESSVVLSGDWSKATEEQKTALLNMFDELGIEDIEVTPGTINPSLDYLEVKVPEEAYNVMVAHEQYRPTTKSIYLDSEGNIANKDVAAPDGKTAKGYTQVRIFQQ